MWVGALVAIQKLTLRPHYLLCQAYYACTLECVHVCLKPKAAIQSIYWQIDANNFTFVQVDWFGEMARMPAWMVLLWISVRVMMVQSHMLHGVESSSAAAACSRGVDRPGEATPTHVARPKWG